MMKTENWQKRYPDIAFYLSFFPYEISELAQNQSDLCDWTDRQALEELEVIYLIGLTCYPLPQKLLDWLEEKSERSLVFVEDQLGAFASFDQVDLIENPQIHFFYSQSDPIEELAEMFPVDRLAIFEGKPFDSTGLFRASSALSALYSDVLYSHKIVENVISNFLLMDNCFDARGKFEGVPAIICGAGPSLKQAIPALKNCGDKALIFAGGSAITALTKEGVNPHFAMALDPNDEEWDRLKQAHFFEGPFLFAPRLHHLVMKGCNGPFGYLKSDTGGFIENFLEAQLGIEGDPVGPDLGREAFSVTTIAVAHAFAMGCNPIIFAGVDLAYTGGKRYPDSIDAKELLANDPRALEKRIQARDIFGNEIETLLKWKMESDCIAEFAKEHKEVRFVNCTEGGMGFSGMENRSLFDELQDLPSRDLFGLVHLWIQQSPLNWKEEKLYPLLDQLRTSLSRVSDLLDQILVVYEANKGEGALALYESDLKEEIAFSALLEGVDIALSRILFRYYPTIDPKEGKRKRDIAKYKELKRQITLFCDVFSKVDL